MADANPHSQTPKSPRTKAAIVVLVALVLLIGCIGLVGIFWGAGRDEALPSEPAHTVADALDAPPAHAVVVAPLPVEPAFGAPYAIVGRVVDADGETVAGAMVDIIGPDGVVTSVETELDGSFATEGLPLALYTVYAATPSTGDASASDVAPGGPPLELVLNAGWSLAVIVKTPAGVDEPATCHLGGAGLFPPREAIAGGDGLCRFGGLPDGEYEVFATAGDTGSRVRSLRVEGERLPFEIRTSPAPAVQVHVVGAEAGAGAGVGPLDDAWITIAPSPLHVVARSELSSAGRVSFRGLAAGRWYVSARATGFLPYGPVAVDLPLSEPLEVAMDRGVQVAGRVIDEAGRPVPMARLVVRVETPDGARWLIDRDKMSVMNRLVRPGKRKIGQGSTYYFSNQAGNFAIGGLPGGELAVEARKDGWSPVELRRLQLENDGIADEIVLRLARGASTRGRVEGPGGGPVEAASVRWRLVGDDVWGWRGETRADEQGVFVLDGVPPQLELEVKAPRFASRRVIVERDVEPGPVVALQPVEGSIVGRLRAVSGAIVGADILPAGRTFDPSLCRAETDKHGRFELTHCGEEPRLLQVRGPSIAPVFFAARAGEEVDLEATAGARLEGRLVLDGVEVEQVEVHVRVEALVRGQDAPHVWETSATAYTDAVELSYLPAGSARVTIRGPGLLTTRREVVLRDDTVEDLGEIRVERVPTVEGVVLDSLGGPVAGARVYAAGAEPLAGHDEATSDAEGRFRVELSTVPSDGSQVRLEAVHWLIGQGEARTKLLPGEPSKLDLRLVHDVGDVGWKGVLEQDGVVAQREERGWVIAEVLATSPWLDNGIQRGDFVEGLRILGGHAVALIVVRDGRRIRVGTFAEEPSP